MSILAWNCRGLEYWAVEARGRSGGLVLIWKTEGGCKVKDSDTHYIDFEVENDQVERWRYTGFYGCPKRSRRRFSWEFLRGLAENSTLSWCVLGDFNDMMMAEDKRGGCAQLFGLLTGFSEMINECGLLDIGFTGEKYTWEKYRGQANWVQERMDRAFTNQLWCDLFPQTGLKVLDVSTSDHLPIYIQLHRQVYVPKKHRFKFENLWLKEDVCRRIIVNGWEEAGNTEILEKIEYYGLKLQEWGGGISKEYNEKMKLCKTKLRNMRSRRDAYGIKVYKKICFTEEKMNSVKKIQNSDGVWCEKNEEIQNVIESYFSNLFTAATLDGRLSEHEEVKKLTEQHKLGMLPIITEE
ncbi:uncharacterized protein LOC141685333 [Apium graveolens]|uniref:uncharacterized protein LOC141685333 n=1 Tax=Apium graveolens TaxID=4045 RepID=UPI003D79C3DE